MGNHLGDSRYAPDLHIEAIFDLLNQKIPNDQPHLPLSGRTLRDYFNHVL